MKHRTALRTIGTGMQTTWQPMTIREVAEQLRAWRNAGHTITRTLTGRGNGLRVYRPAGFGSSKQISVLSN